jgi:hypothetical protein
MAPAGNRYNSLSTARFLKVAKSGYGLTQNWTFEKLKSYDDLMFFLLVPEYPLAQDENYPFGYAKTLLKAESKR